MKAQIRHAPSLAARAMLALISCSCRSEEVVETAPCVLYSARIHPLLVRDSTRLEIGTLVVSDCQRTPKPLSVSWRTRSSSVIRLERDGRIVGLAPGPFEVVAHRDTTALPIEGFVVPPGWRISAVAGAPFTVHVGDPLRLVIRAEDSSATPLPALPFSIFTPEFLHPDAIQMPLVDKYSFQNVTSPVVFIARRVGRTVLTGSIGNERISIPLTVLPSK